MRALADGSTTARAAHAVAMFGWPSKLITQRVALYVGCSRSTITRAAQAGELVPCGRRGRSLVFDRSEVDRWLSSANDTAPSPSASAMPPVRPTSLSSGSSTSSADAIARLRAIARGAR